MKKKRRKIAKEEHDHDDARQLQFSHSLTFLPTSIHPFPQAQGWPQMS